MNQEARGRTADKRFTTIDGRLADSQGQVMPGTSGWAQHPQASRATRRLQPMPQHQPQQPQQHGHPEQLYDQYGQPYPMVQQQPNVNVNVSHDGNYYRPWKEELMISGFRSIGNVIAWPFRLIANLLGGALRLALMFVIVPAMIFGAISFYQSHQDKPATEMAHDVGKAGVGLVGAAFGGIWDGIFGGDEPAAKDEPAKVDNADKAEPESKTSKASKD